VSCTIVDRRRNHLDQDVKVSAAISVYRKDEGEGVRVPAKLGFQRS
jgi:hypothetical protein